MLLQERDAAQEQLEEQRELYSRERSQHELTASELARLRRQLRVLLRDLPSGEVDESSQRVTLEVRVVALLSFFSSPSLGVGCGCG